MRALGRVFFLLLSIATGVWLALSAFYVYLAMKNPDAVPERIGMMLIPLLLFVVCAWFFNGLGPKDASKKE